MTEVRTFHSDHTLITVRADTFWLDLGHLRRVVAAADNADLPDKADVSFEGITRCAVRVDERFARRVNVRYNQPKGGTS